MPPFDLEFSKSSYSRALAPACGALVLARMYKCSGRVIALLPASAASSALLALTALALANG